MNYSLLLLKSARGFERWRRAVYDKAVSAVVTQDDDAPDPILKINRPEMLNDNATTKDIALWAARERQFIVIHNRTQQRLEFMDQSIELSLYERVINYSK
ncbi:hypothetical protein OnM2_098039 [Erysiphe neolycopersici]|uniref:Uncharacterized protein n=1 Tax=Erysiphe neolycopersici TaxID=212602 RepID=A0A420HAD1_9PEZI|nr:hypothetical protein OnM2_098039 [Erysiphe neolycopersici]